MGDMASMGIIMGNIVGIMKNRKASGQKSVVKAKAEAKYESEV